MTSAIEAGAFWPIALSQLGTAITIAFPFTDLVCMGIEFSATITTRGYCVLCGLFWFDEARYAFASQSYPTGLLVPLTLGGIGIGGKKYLLGKKR